MPAVDEWTSKLRSTVDPRGAVTDEGVQAAMLKMVLGAFAASARRIADIHSQSLEAGEKMIRSLVEAAAEGALDAAFLEASVALAVEHLPPIARQLNDKALGDATAAERYEREGGGVGRLLEALVRYVWEHPFATG